MKQFTVDVIAVVEAQAKAQTEAQIKIAKVQTEARKEIVESQLFWKWWYENTPSKLEK